ncbi:2Fe-2S ferredoxin-type domain-containing protein [Lasiosphaeria miniovina]|uniref:2Fe-2S ferredoxin-type domain-containing protein n=1 Tax=Lasiosphaeria miniovina TaxID=1954250 RepID=A0AA40B581_9PEZI|nr:2Fe-2S ferredoxin-type domain-containing protein [Lasiosphaeria miniovina]KAK0727828.1 2Fe-2S ferredoxin-type domain-containing protein [Lasiosphaeria miniovina]
MMPRPRLAQGLRSLRLVPRLPSGCIAQQQARCNSRLSAAPRLAIPGCSPRLATSRDSRLSLRFQPRLFSTSSALSHGHVDPPKPGEELYVTFIDKEGLEYKLAVSKGDNLLDIAQAHDLEMEGACGGSCACSTCHVIVTDEEFFDKIPAADDDENDMLDLAFGLTETSRLGCQVVMTPELDGLRVKLPSMTRNLQESDFK